VIDGEAALRGRLFLVGPETVGEQVGLSRACLKPGGRDSEVVCIPQTYSRGRDLEEMDRFLAEVAA